MTHHGDFEIEKPQPERGMPRWLMLAITVVAFCLPIAGMLMLLWPLVLRRTSLAADGLELGCLAVATVVIAGTLTSYAHRLR